VNRFNGFNDLPSFILSTSDSTWRLFRKASWTDLHPCRNRRRSCFQDLHSAPIADSMLSSALDRTRVGAALWRIHVESLTKRRDKRFEVLRAGECGHAVEPSLLSFSFLFEHLFKPFVAFDKPPEIRCRQPASSPICVSTSFFPMPRSNDQKPHAAKPMKSRPKPLQLQYHFYEEDRRPIRTLAAWLAGQGERPSDARVIRASDVQNGR
jgi:hypothetical protein